MSQDKEREAPIQWTLNGDKECHYNNWLGITPFGRILITWKGWKDHPSASVDEFPGELPPLFGSPDYVKQEAEREFMRRAALASQQAGKGEPVAAQHRFRRPQKGTPDWSEWQQCKVSSRPPWEIDSAGYEVEYRNLYASPPSREPQWQPIETAPKDGTWVFLYTPEMSISDYPLVAFWDDEWASVRDSFVTRIEPTHWMPLPPAPTKESP